MEIRRNSIFKTTLFWLGTVLEPSFCLWKALLKLDRIQFFKNIPARGRLLLQVQNWFSGKRKPFFLHFSEISTSGFSSTGKVFFNGILHFGLWKQIFWLVETVLFCSVVFLLVKPSLKLVEINFIRNSN